MKNKLEDYVVVKPFLNKEICNKTLQELEVAEWKVHEFYFVRDDKSEPISHGFDSYTTKDIIPSHKIIMDRIWKAIHKYIEDLQFHWFYNWEGFSSLKFNRYTNNQFMKEHCDHIHDLFDGKVKGVPILSIIGALNDDYEGGELMMFQNKPYKLKAGEIIIFPSNFLYPHKVMPVSKGTRYTYVSWVY